MPRKTANANKTAVTLIGCIGLLSISLVAGAQSSDWSPAANLGGLINSSAEEFAPHVSKNGLSLYFTSTRPGGFGGEDLWVARRSDRNDPWGLPVNLGAVINTGANERSPTLSRDGHHLFFATTRPGGSGGFDIWASWRHDKHDDLAWSAPVHLGPELNSAATDAGPDYFENDDGGIPLLFLASNRPGGTGGLDIYVSTLTRNATFGPPVLIPELNGEANDLTPAIRHDGLEIIIATNRAGGVGAQDLWVATRNEVGDRWSAPAPLGPLVNSSLNDSFPCLSSDRNTLLFSSDRSGGFGGNDIYMTTRSGRGRNSDKD